MKQAIIMLAHKDVDEVLELSQILKQKFAVYVHFNARLELTEKYKQKLKENGIHYLQEVDTHWGGWSLSEAVIHLIKEALKDSNIGYFHIISAQDWPAKPVEEVYQYYEDNPNIYLTYVPARNIKKSGEPILLWQKYYYNYDSVNRRTVYGKFYHRGLLLIQAILRIDKLKKYKFDMELYHGALWMDMPREVMEFCLKTFENNVAMQKIFKTGFCPDEFWIHTILCNSPYRSEIINDNHRYVKWEKKYGTYPAILDIDDYEKIMEGNYHFVRKVDSLHSGPLKNKLIRIETESHNYGRKSHVN